MFPIQKKQVVMAGKQLYINFDSLSEVKKVK